MNEVLPYLQIFPESGTQLDTSYQWTAQETAETDENGETIAAPSETGETEASGETESSLTTDGVDDTSGYTENAYPDEWAQYGYTDEDGDGIPDQWGE